MRLKPRAREVKPGASLPVPATGAAGCPLGGGPLGPKRTTACCGQFMSRCSHWEVEPGGRGTPYSRAVEPSRLGFPSPTHRVSPASREHDTLWQSWKHSSQTLAPVTSTVASAAFFHCPSQFSDPALGLPTPSLPRSLPEAPPQRLLLLTLVLFVPCMFPHISPLPS